MEVEGADDGETVEPSVRLTFFARDTGSGSRCVGSCETDVGWGRLLAEGIRVAGRLFTFVLTVVLLVDVGRREGRGIELLPFVVFG